MDGLNFNTEFKGTENSSDPQMNEMDTEGGVAELWGERGAGLGGQLLEDFRRIAAVVGMLTRRVRGSRASRGK